ncbi:hypothetical protein L1856_31210 [Streptomyces sp. Tue 6430]|nr:hypothetical protein [Streptomyces sp. Tue 6430]
MSGPPCVVPGGGVGAGGDVVGVSGGLQLGLHAGGEAVAGADRGDEPAGDQLAEGRVGVGVADQGGQMGLVRDLAAEGDGEAQGGAGGGAEPGGEQRRGRGGLAQRGQGVRPASAGGVSAGRGR